MVAWKVYCLVVNLAVTKGVKKVAKRAEKMAV